MEDSNTWENIKIKTSLKDYCLHKIKIKEKCLFLCYNENYNNNEENDKKIMNENIMDKKNEFFNDKYKEDEFYLIIPLYKINIELYRIIHPPLLNDNKILQSIPEYYKKIRISSSEIYDLYDSIALLY